MKFTWKPITDINNLPKGVEIMVCIKENYCEYIRREAEIEMVPLVVAKKNGVLEEYVRLKAYQIWDGKQPLYGVTPFGMLQK